MYKDKIIFTCVTGFIILIALYFSMKKLSQKKSENINYIYDLTRPISEHTPVFPGDPIFQKEKVSSIDEGCCFNLFKITMGNHTGTHIDFPAHVIYSGKTSSNYNIHDLIGDGIIIEVPVTMNSITSAFIQQQKIKKNDFVLFKTEKSDVDYMQFNEKFVFIEPDAAALLLRKRVRLIGTDAISVDSYHAEHLPVHHLFLSNDVLIVESLNFVNINPGRCHLTIAPLNIRDMDGLPARVLMSRV